MSPTTKLTRLLSSRTSSRAPRSRHSSSWARWSRTLSPTTKLGGAGSCH
jgi:hypothetical protein